TAPQIRHRWPKATIPSGLSPPARRWRYPCAAPGKRTPERRSKPPQSAPRAMHAPCGFQYLAARSVSLGPTPAPDLASYLLDLRFAQKTGGHEDQDDGENGEG